MNTGTDFGIIQLLNVMGYKIFFLKVIFGDAFTQITYIKEATIKCQI